MPDTRQHGSDQRATTNGPRDSAVEEIREATRKRRRAAAKQMTPEAEPDNSIEGEGSIGLTISGGANA